MQPVTFWDDSRTQLNTPEQVELQLEIANLGSRGLALMIDLAIRYGVFVVLYFIFALTTNFHFLEAEMSIGLKGFALLFLFVVFVSEWFYFTLFEWLWNGQTPGKRIMHLRVIKVDGSPAGWLEIVLRNFTRPIDTTGPMAIIGITCIFLQPRAQRPGDIAARTIVIRETPIDWKSFFPKEEITSSESHAPLALSSSELEMIQRYRQRAAALDPVRRRELAARIRITVQPRTLGTELEASTLDDEAWLEALSKRI